MGKAYDSEEPGRRVFRVAMAGIFLQIAAMVWIVL